jgi:hypothetical protein
VVQPLSEKPKLTEDEKPNASEKKTLREKFTGRYPWKSRGVPQTLSCVARLFITLLTTPQLNESGYLVIRGRVASILGFRFVRSSTSCPAGDGRRASGVLHDDGGNRFSWAT